MTERNFPNRSVGSRHRPLRLAILALAISHFEVPLFRLCAQAKELEIKVFYILPVKVKRFDIDYRREIDWGYDLLAEYDSQQVGDSKELERAVLEWGADVVMLYGYGWPGAARIILRNWLTGRPQVHRGTLNYYLDPRRPLKGRIMRPLGRMLLRLFNAHHYGGDYSRKVLLDAGARESSLFFVPYSVDTPHFLGLAGDPEQKKAALAIRRGQGWENDDHVLLFIAQHNWFKGPDIAMEVFKRIAEIDEKARFLVVGSGGMTGEMKNYSKKYLNPKHIHFTGFIPSAKTIACYLASDLVICTSRYETWARMVNEAMLCRRPCLVSRVVPAAGGLVMDNENGYVVQSPKASEFIPVIEKHFGLPMETRKKMGEAARKKAKTFAYEPYVDNIVASVQYAFSHSRQTKKIESRGE